MYMPYLRGKQFELEAIIDLPSKIFRNTTPIIEPVSSKRKNQFRRIAEANIPLVLVVNPYHPKHNEVPEADIHSLITETFKKNTAFALGYLVDNRFDILHLQKWLNVYGLTHSFVLIFRSEPHSNVLNAIKKTIKEVDVLYFVFESRLSHSPSQMYFEGSRILISDGFQREDRNADYADSSSFTSIYSNFVSLGWKGFGDYATVGDHFREGGGPVYVVTIHVTTPVNKDITTYHFSSTINSTLKAQAPIKFADALQNLVNGCKKIKTTTGLEIFYDWHDRGHFPGLGAAKKASIMHHIEMVSSKI